MDESHKKKSLIDYLNSVQRGWGLASFGFNAIGGSAIATIIAISVALFLILMSTPGLSATQENAISSSPMPIENLGDFVVASGTSQSEIQTITDALSLGLSFPLYKSLLTNGGVVKVTFEKDPIWNGGHVDGITLDGTGITIRSGLSSEKLKYTFLHETGHVIMFRTGILGSYPYNSLIDVSSPDFSCYRNGYLKTYPIIPIDGTPGDTSKIESFAESVSQFMLYKERPDLNDFPNQCKDTYRWFKENVFVGPSK